MIDRKNLTKYSLYVVDSKSMTPTLDVDDIVVVKQEDAYKVDDIITFTPYSDSKETYTHRIIDIEDDSGEAKYITKGDNNDIEDNFSVTDKNTLGKVTKIIKGWGRVISYIRSIPGIIVTIIVPVTMLVTLYLSDMYQWIKGIYNREKGLFRRRKTN